jgi:hypothetical protein
LFDPGDSYGISESLNLALTPLGAREGQVHSDVSVGIFRSRVGLGVESKFNEDQSETFTALVYKIDQNNPYQTNKAYAYQGDSIPDYPVEVKVQKTTIVPRQTGEYYDYINKVVVPQYTYDEVKEIIETSTIRTDSQGRASIIKSYPKELDKQVWYNISFVVRDAKNVAKQWVANYNPNNNQYSEGLPYYNPNPAPGEQPKVTDWKPELVLSPSKSEQGFSIGEQVQLGLAFNNKTNGPKNPVPTLYYAYQRSILMNQVVSSNKAQDSFKKEYRPGVSYKAVVFGPNGFEETYGTYAQYNTKDATLKISIEPDKEGYKPGEEAKLKIKVRDQADKPVAASVNVAVVDEAIFSLSNYGTNNTIDDLYQYVIVNPLVSYTRYYGQPSNDGGGGGGGDEPPRLNFQDTAHWRNVEVGSNGETEIAFKLPDNITEWRATVRAYNDDSLFAGTEQKAVIATLPLFADLALSDTYLAGDQPQLLVRFAGKKYKYKEAVTVKASSDALKLSFEKTTKETELSIPLPKLAEGKFDIDISISQGELHDAIRRTISVIPSYFVTTQSKDYTVSENLTGVGHSDTGLTRYVFSDAGKGKYVPALYVRYRIDKNAVFML